jgi:hypothetical protein
MTPEGVNVFPIYRRRSTPTLTFRANLGLTMDDAVAH